MERGMAMDENLGGVTFSPIGYVRSSGKFRFEAARQGVFCQNSGRIELLPGFNYEQALEDLAGFERIWVIYVFHLNSGWRPKASPPVAPRDRRFGLFSTRAPYRPNPIGMSCVQLEKIDGLTLYIRNFDMLADTPVLDIKPYIPEIDSFPDSRAGWRDEFKASEWEIRFGDEFISRASWIFERAELDIVNFCRVQLRYSPLNESKKRVEKASSGKDSWLIGCRTWKILFRADEKARLIEVDDVFSNYTEADLMTGTDDVYGDKDLHRAFNIQFCK